MIIAAAAVVPHWRMRAKIDVLNIEMSALGGKTTFPAGSVAASELSLSSISETSSKIRRL